MRILKDNTCRYYKDENEYCKKRGVVGVQAFDWKQLSEETLTAIADKVFEVSGGKVEMVQMDSGSDSVVIGYLTAESKSYAEEYIKVARIERVSKRIARRRKK